MDPAPLPGSLGGEGFLALVVKSSKGDDDYKLEEKIRHHRKGELFFIHSLECLSLANRQYEKTEVWVGSLWKEDQDACNLFACFWQHPGGYATESSKESTSEFFFGELNGFNDTLLDSSSHESTGFAGACAVYLGDGVVGVLGGYNNANELMTAFDTYDTKTGMWKKMPGGTFLIF